MILHLDLDSFFASAHRSRDKRLLHRPIAVGGRSNLRIFDRVKRGIRLYNNNSGAFVNPVFYHQHHENFERFFVDHINGKRKIRGIITTASYEARAYGVKTGMSVAEALRLCPDLIVVVPDYLLYHELSHAIYQFLEYEIPAVEQYSIDEFFGDPHGWIEDREILSFAYRLQREIRERFGLPISIGIAKGKWIAKLATEYAKPNGVCLIPKDENMTFIKDIPIEKFPGISKGYKKRLERYKIETLGEALKRKDLFYGWGKQGKILYHRIKGDDGERISVKNSRKSIGLSRTFDPIRSREEIRRRIVILARHIVYMAQKIGANPTTYYVGVRYDFGQRIKGRKTVNRLFSEALCKAIFVEIFEEIDLGMGSVTKLSVRVSNFSDQKRKTLSLLEWDQDVAAQQLSRSIQEMREKYTLDVIKGANEL